MFLFFVTVLDTSGLVDNVGESGDDSEDEWNYFKGDTEDKEKLSPSQTDTEVTDLRCITIIFRKLFCYCFNSGLVQCVFQSYFF